MDTTLRIAPDVAVIRSAEPVPGHGVLPVRSFLILGREPVLVDTGMARESDDFVAALESVLDPRDLRWIVVTHADGDHAGALPALLQRAPRALFASDAFGAIVPSDVPFLDDAHERESLEGMSFFCRANSPWLADVKVGTVLSRAASLPGEGPVALASQRDLEAALAQAA